MVDWRLSIFPSNGLDRSLHAPIWVGLVVMTFFTEAFGWTYAGLVVPGYMGAVLAAAPVTALLIAVEAVLTYLLVAGVGQWLTVSGAWSTAFGRERFFLFIVGSMVVRVFMEGFIVPHVVARYSFAHSRELYSVGLVLVPLFANVFWSSGILSAGPRLVVVTLIVYVVVELVLVRHTNFSVSRLLIANESGSQKFLASPKLEIILLLGALIGAQGNVRYGWDYNGILVPALLGVAWYEPTKFLSTLVEAVAVYGLSRGLVALPPFSRLLVVGTRRMLVAFTVGFLAKIVIGFVVGRLAPRVQLVDYLGMRLPAPVAAGREDVEQGQDRRGAHADGPRIDGCFRRRQRRRRARLVGRCGHQRGAGIRVYTDRERRRPRGRAHASRSLSRPAQGLWRVGRPRSRGDHADVRSAICASTDTSTTTPCARSLETR